MTASTRPFSPQFGPILPATTVLTALHLLALIAIVCFPELERRLFLSPGKLLVDKQVWLIPGSVFWFHANAARAGLYLVGFILLGIAAERNLGSRWFAAQYLIGSMLTALCWAISAARGIGSEQELTRKLLLDFPPGTGVVITLALLDRPLGSIRLFRLIPVPVWLIAVAWLTLEFRYFGFENYPVSIPTLLFGAANALLLRRIQDSDGLRRWLEGSHRAPEAVRSETASIAAAGPDDREPSELEDRPGTLAAKTLARLQEQQNADPVDHDPELDAKVDELLKKIAESGADSLSEDEIQVLLAASERYRQRREG
jgi:hypothetical protein